MHRVGRWLAAVVVVVAFGTTASWQPPSASAQVEGGDFVLTNFWWTTPVLEYRVNLAGAPPGALDAILAAQETWNAVPGSQAELRYVGSTTTAQTAFDGVNVVYWAPLSEGLGKTTWQLQSQCATCQGRPVGFDITIDSDAAITVGALGSRNFDLESLMVHEFGHAFGLDHPSNPSQAMFMTLFSGTEVRELAAGDIRALQLRYPDANADVNCDDVVNILDALAVAQFAVSTRVDTGRCPVTGSHDSASIFALMGNANGDDEVNIADAFLVAKCAVGLPTPICDA